MEGEEGGVSAAAPARYANPQAATATPTTPPPTHHRVREVRDEVVLLRELLVELLRVLLVRVGVCDGLLCDFGAARVARGERGSKGLEERGQRREGDGEGRVRARRGAALPAATARATPVP